MYHAGLVLEGGGMKGVYTAGVLDYFLDKKIEFSTCYGVSAGACVLCSYLSKQRRRAFRTLTEYLDDKRYMGIRNLLTEGNYFNGKFCYDLIPNYLDPYDHEAFYRYQGKAYAVVMDIRTGEPNYLQLKDLKKDITIVQASASLPIFSRNIPWNGKLYLDGGIADGIPLAKSMEDGNQKNVVILTKDKAYRRKKTNPWVLLLMKIRYVFFPKVPELMATRHDRYNGQLDFMEEQERLGNCYVIRPSRDCKVDRMEKNPKVLEEMYQLGYEDGEKHYQSLLEYLNK